mmetsp:Transcript_10005/g.32106  ORF Transcript_10005/g.32106 Transcript_10005/m.32106 type:complete len:327 (-) Transcript_10005:147-1127(-)
MHTSATLFSLVALLPLGAASGVAWELSAGAAAAAVMLAVSSVRIISTGEEALVERLGRFERRLHPGLSFVIPGIERVSIYASIREQVLDVPPQPCITSDNAPLSADAVVFFRIKDLARARYAVDDFRACVTNLVLTQLRSEIGQLTLDQTFAARERLNQKLLEEANAVAAGWGIDVTRIEVRDIHPSPEIVSSMEMQMAAERKKRAAILQSEGEKAALINAAEGRREATVLGARGEQERLQMEARGLADSLDRIAASLEGGASGGAAADGGAAARRDAARLLLHRQHVAALASVAGSSNAKVLLFPTHAKQLANAAVLGDAVAGNA